MALRRSAVFAAIRRGTAPAFDVRQGGKIGAFYRPVRSSGVRSRVCNNGAQRVPRLLDDVLLGELEAEWRAQGVDYLDAFRPGLDDAEIDRATEPLGFELPEEARRWYRWRDGSDAYDVVFARYIASLREAVEMTVDNVAIVPDD